MDKQLFRRTLLLVALFVVSLVIRQVLLGGVGLTSLGAASPLAAAVAPSIASSGSSSLPEVGKDFKILSSQSFDSAQWAVVSVAHIPDMNRTTLVVEKLNGVDTVVLGPGTSFSSTVLRSIPVDVANYLISKGLIHDQVGQ